MKRMGTRADQIRDEAAAFGSSIHAGLEAHVSGRSLLPVSMPEEWVATIEAGRRWIDANVEEAYAIERPVTCPAYGYAGTPDLYCRLIGQKLPTLIDWKTTAGVYPEHRFQTAAYRRAAVDTYGDKAANRKVLLFSKDQPGEVTAHTFTRHEEDFRGFTYCLGLYRILKQGG